VAAYAQWRNTNYRSAIVGALALLAALFLVVPESWLRWIFHREFGRPPAELALDPRARETGPIRLIPVEMLSPAAARPEASRIEPRAERLVPERVEPTPDEDLAGPAQSRWTWDPTTAYSISGELTRPRFGQAAPDTVALRATFLRALRLGDLDPALAMLDTTQSALAREQFREVDRWFFRHWAEIWKAQGNAARSADIYERAVLEAERDKGM
jgi:hypothetical protein